MEIKPNALQKVMVLWKVAIWMWLNVSSDAYAQNKTTPVPYDTLEQYTYRQILVPIGPQSSVHIYTLPPEVLRRIQGNLRNNLAIFDARGNLLTYALHKPSLSIVSAQVLERVGPTSVRASVKEYKLTKNSQNSRTNKTNIQVVFVTSQHQPFTLAFARLSPMKPSISDASIASGTALLRMLSLEIEKRLQRNTVQAQPIRKIHPAKENGLPRSRLNSTSMIQASYALWGLFFIGCGFLCWHIIRLARSFFPKT